MKLRRYSSQKYKDDEQFNTNYCVANIRFNAFKKIIFMIYGFLYRLNSL